MKNVNFIFFWRETESNGCFSQWFFSNQQFWSKKDQLWFNCTEQYMMYHKAMLFGAKDIAQQIMGSKKPKEHKKLGRRIESFQQEIWDNECQKIVYEGNSLKFTQNKEFLNALLLTEGKELVEASPYDTIWGIGLSAEDPDALDKSKWKGKNYLGNILTQLRKDLI